MGGTSSCPRSSWHRRHRRCADSIDVDEYRAANTERVGVRVDHPPEEELPIGRLHDEDVTHFRRAARPLQHGEIHGASRSVLERALAAAGLKGAVTKTGRRARRQSHGMHPLYNLGESLDRVEPGSLLPDDRILAGSTSAVSPPPRLRAGGFVPDTPPPASLSHVSDGE